jgi:hypothetical protein
MYPPFWMVESLCDRRRSGEGHPNSRGRNNHGLPLWCPSFSTTLDSTTLDRPFLSNGSPKMLKRKYEFSLTPDRVIETHSLIILTPGRGISVRT